MAKTKMYEAVVIFKVLDEENMEASVEKIKSLISENGNLGIVDDWGKRKLAYPINDLNEGYYMLFNFESDTEFPAELERICNISENVLRVLIVAKN